ncbi:MAG: isoprenylcysteine carboxylmethyltransferase family protein [Gammaproteobacteria bacterium]|nr:isoprenylcysteine carboxylmethyltransferase family protein [Gammaproteobacteria bacterium]MCF6260231.1 isoprenylcysteine carboxylmethyltransferase family protein [Gammaproteobacteria bacterium]
MHSVGYAYGMWVVVAFNVGLFLFFTLSFLKPRGSQEWRSMSVVTAFFVALFAEMYGFPLTIYLLTGWLGDTYPALEPFSHKLGHLWVVVLGGSTLAWAVVMALSLTLMLMGYTLLSKGWTQIHAARGGLVTDGIYSYARHPQYTGLFLVIIGFLVQWPTILTVIMAPALLFAYVHLARVEERRAEVEFGVEYNEYVRKTPAFFPRLNQWKAFLTVNVPDEETS